MTKTITLFTTVSLFIAYLLPVDGVGQEEVVPPKAAVPRITVLEDDWGGAPPSNIRAICLSVAQELSEFFPQRTFAPIVITFWAIAWIIQRLDNLLLPRVLSWVVPGLEEAPRLPPLVGALFTFLVILAAGVFVRHFFGHSE